MKKKTTAKKPRYIQFLYRDGDNYKFTLTMPESEVKALTGLKKLKHKQEILYTQLGYTRKRFHDEVVGYKYDRTSDHNILEIIDLNADPETITI